MAGYKTFTSAADMGPYVSKLILELPEKVRTEFVDKAGFSVYVERKDAETGEVSANQGGASSILNTPEASRISADIAP